jgi:putative membrane protein
MMHDGWMFGMGWLWFILLIVIVVAVLVAMRAGTRGGPRSESSHGDGAKNAEDILRDRLARGEIDEEEYRNRMNALRER